MKRPKKPTLAQLNKRSAWWIDEEGDILISFPCGKCERMFGDEWGLSSWFSHHLWDAGFEFGGWI